MDTRTDGPGTASTRVSDFYGKDEPRLRADSGAAPAAGGDSSGGASAGDYLLPRSAGLRRPLLLSVLTLAVAVAAILLALRGYQLEEERQFLAPTALLGTEAYLIEALKKRADLDISRRDRIIADYKRRLERREAVAQRLDAASATLPAPAQESGAASAETPAAEASAPPEARETEAPSPAGGAAEALARLEAQAGVDQFVEEMLLRAIEAVNSALAAGDLSAAATALAELRGALSRLPSSDSPALRSARRMDAALSRILTELAEPPAQAGAGAAEARAKALQAEMTALAAEKTALEERLAAVTALVAASTRGGAVVGGFLGTVSVVGKSGVILDLSRAVDAAPGARVLIFRPEGEGRGRLVAIARLGASRDTTVELEILSYVDREDRVRIQDSAYLAR